MKRKYLVLLLALTAISINIIGCTSTTEPDSTETLIEATEAISESTEATESTEAPDSTTGIKIDTASDEYLNLANCLSAIYDVQAGSAGTSLRAETAAEAVIEYINNYAKDIEKEKITAMTFAWINENKVSAPDFSECLDATCDVAIDKHNDLAADKNFSKVVTGIQDALK